MPSRRDKTWRRQLRREFIEFCKERHVFGFSILAAIVLSLAGCGSIAGAVLPGVDSPQVQEDIATLEADVAEFKADLDAAKVANLPGIESFVAAIASKDYAGAAIELAVLIPQLKASAPELIQDARAIVADLRHLVSDATGRKAVATAARAAKRATVKP